MSVSREAAVSWHCVFPHLCCILLLLLPLSACENSYLVYDATPNAFLRLPLQFSAEPTSITLSLWTRWSGPHINQSSILFFVGSNASLASAPLPGWGIQRTSNSPRDGYLSLIDINSAGDEVIVPLRTNLSLNDWSYLSFVLSWIEKSNRISISLYTNGKLSATTTTYLSWKWTPEPAQYVYVGGWSGNRSTNWYGATFRLGLWSSLLTPAEISECMRGVRPPELSEDFIHLWSMSEGASTYTSDSVTGLTVPLPDGVSWSPLETCGDGALQRWEQCDVAVGTNCTKTCVCSPAAVMSSPPSIDCVASQSPILAPGAAAPEDEETNTLTRNVLIFVWVVAIGGAGSYFVASQFWRRFLPPKVPTAVIVKIGTSDDLKVLEKMERMDRDREEQLIESEREASRYLYEDIDETANPALQNRPEKLPRSWASDTEQSKLRQADLLPPRSATVVGFTPPMSRRRMEDLEEDEIPHSRFGALSGPEYVRSAPVSPVPHHRSISNSSDDEII